VVQLWPALLLVIFGGGLISGTYTAPSTPGEIADDFFDSDSNKTLDERREESFLVSGPVWWVISFEDYFSDHSLLGLGNPDYSGEEYWMIFVGESPGHDWSHFEAMKNVNDGKSIILYSESKVFNQTAMSALVTVEERRPDCEFQTELWEFDCKDLFDQAEMWITLSPVWVWGVGYGGGSLSVLLGLRSFRHWWKFR